MARILIVEDNEMNRDMLAKRLRRRGHTIEVAEDGARGVAYVGAFTPDLVLMDMNMPVLDGWEATRLLKSKDDTQHVSIVALTAHALPADRDKAMAAGCDAYLTKPVQFDELCQTIDSLLGGKGK